MVLPGDNARALLGCYILLGWCLWHPFMYHQQTNWEFVLETLTIMGGLCILLSHFLLLAAPQAPTKALPHAKAVSNPAATAAKSAEATRAHAIQATGRVLIVSVFLYYAFQKVRPAPSPSASPAC